MKGLNFFRCSKASSSIAATIIFTFLTLMTFGTTFTSCGSSGSDSTDDGGGGGDNGGGDDGGDTTTSFDDFQSTTTDSTGKATFTPTKLKDSSGNSLTSLEVTLTLPSGGAAANFAVYFTEADDSHYMVIGKDPNSAYQTIFLTGDSQQITVSSSVSAQALNLESGLPAPAVASLRYEKDFGITIVSLAIVAGVALVFTVSAISLQNKINSVAGKIDPLRLVRSGSDCFSFATLLDYFDIATEAVGLVFWVSSTLASGGTTATMDSLYEIVLDQITDSIKDRVEDAFWDQVASSAFSAFSIEKDTNICWILRSPAAGYSKIFEVRPDRTCEVSTDCDSLTSTAQDFSAIDGDHDGYTPAADDCNDENALINPGAEEVCDDDIDQDCSGSDQACNLTAYGYMQCYTGPEEGIEYQDGGSGNCAVLSVQGSFDGTGATDITQALVQVNNQDAQRVGLEWGSYLTLVGVPLGVSYITMAGHSGSAYGKKTLHFTNTGTLNDLTIILTWVGDQTLDLYVNEPDGTTVYYGNATGTDGTLSVPVYSGWGPDIYIAPTANTSGDYAYYAKYRSGSGSVNYTIYMMSAYGSQVKTGTLSSAGENSTTYAVGF